MRKLTRKPGSVARRIRVSFILAAALPLLTLAAVSYYLVSEQLEQRALRDAHLLSKGIGMAIYDRLKFIGDELAIFRDHGEKLQDELPDLAGLDLQERIHSLFAVMPNGEFRGSLILSAAQQEDLLRQVAQADAHKSLLITSGGSSIRRLFLLIPDLDARGAVHWLGAELDTAYLWNTSDAGERPERICVLGPDDLPVYCNHHDTKDWLAESSDLMRTRARPQSLQLSSGEEILTAAWSLYLRPHYQFERWTILAGVPQAMALASIRAFDRIFASTLR